MHGINFIKRIECQLRWRLFNQAAKEYMKGKKKLMFITAAAHQRSCDRLQCTLDTLHFYGAYKLTLTVKLQWLNASILLFVVCSLV